jgi:hypothetical protein
MGVQDFRCEAFGFFMLCKEGYMTFSSFRRARGMEERSHIGSFP